jgi:YD repeat-containing protein
MKSGAQTFASSLVPDASASEPLPLAANDNSFGILSYNDALTANLAAASRTIYDGLGRDIEDDVGTVFSGTTVTTWVMAKTTTFTPTSKVASVTDGDNRTTTTSYDPADRVSLVTDPVLRQTLTGYDPASNVLTETRGLGTQNNAVYATYTYGADNEKTSVIDALGATHLTQYAYDGFNRLATTTYPDSSTEQITLYDANSNIKTRINRGSQSFSYTYDALNRNLTKVIPAYGSTAAETITNAYDLGGRIDEVSDSFGDSLVHSYDTAGRLDQTATTITGLTGALAATYTLDANGNRTELLWPDGYYIGYCFDSMNRMTVAMANSTSSGCATNVLATYSYDPYSRRTNLAYGASASMAYTYTPASDLTSLTLNMTSTANDNAWTLGYSNAHQLASDAASIANYKWEPACATSPCTDAYATVNNLNQYPSVTPSGGTAQTQTHDGNGNLTGDGSLTYSYDPENRLMKACNTSGCTGTMSAAYACKGRRQNVPDGGVKVYQSG